jgi:hypothetical protein
LRGFFIFIIPAIPQGAGAASLQPVCNVAALAWSGVNRRWLQVKGPFTAAFVDWPFYGVFTR